MRRDYRGDGSLNLPLAGIGLITSGSQRIRINEVNIIRCSKRDGGENSASTSPQPQSQSSSLPPSSIFVCHNDELLFSAMVEGSLRD